MHIGVCVFSPFTYAICILVLTETNKLLQAEICIKRHKHISYLPKPLYNNMRRRIFSLIICVLSPIIHINISKSTHEKFEFVFIEYFQQIIRNEFVEALKKNIYLSIYANGHTSIQIFAGKNRQHLEKIHETQKFCSGGTFRKIQK